MLMGVIREENYTITKANKNEAGAADLSWLWDCLWLNLSLCQINISGTKPHPEEWRIANQNSSNIPLFDSQTPKSGSVNDCHEPK